MLEPLLRTNLPTMYDLPSEEVGEPGLPDDFHCWQGPLLSLTFRPPSWPGAQVYSAYDLYLYYDVSHTLWYKRPDWFGVVGVSRLYQGKDLRQSYVIWQEQVTPAIAIEILSPSTEDEDLGRTKRKPGKPPTKWEVYEQILQIPNYVVFDENTRMIQLFQLIDGKYQETALTQSLVWIEDVQLNLGLWNGDWNKSFQPRWWLRWYDQLGNLMLTPEELEQRRAEQADRRAEQSDQRAERLAAKLRELGLDPDQM
jgi:Uma2 family endonuclease